VSASPVYLLPAEVIIINIQKRELLDECSGIYKSTADGIVWLVYQLTMGWMVQGLNPCGGQEFPCPSRVDPRPIQHRVQWILPRDKAAGV